MKRKPRESVTRGTAPKAWWNPYYIPAAVRKIAPARVQGEKSRGNTRDRAET